MQNANENYVAIWFQPHMPRRAQIMLITIDNGLFIGMNFYYELRIL